MSSIEQRPAVSEIGLQDASFQETVQASFPDMSRRRFLGQAAVTVFELSAVGALVEACNSTSNINTAPATKTPTMATAEKQRLLQAANAPHDLTPTSEGGLLDT
ncbi:MAG TPA: hypothetical protein VLF89_00800 [Candidatus Saccharimonadales bacterium]|nr:hypothetical protein [Candidatus Saccharimonadales bacterium]